MFRGELTSSLSVGGGIKGSAGPFLDSVGKCNMVDSSHYRWLCENEEYVEFLETMFGCDSCGGNVDVLGDGLGVWKEDRSKV